MNAPQTVALVDLRDDPRYYLRHFRLVLDWVQSRYEDLLATPERDFLDRFAALPDDSQALLVRMITRKGELFRVSRLAYDEIGDSAAAMAPLADAGFAEIDPRIGLDELFGQLRLPELREAFAERMRQDGLGGAVSKARLRQALDPTRSSDMEEAGDGPAPGVHEARADDGPRAGDGTDEAERGGVSRRMSAWWPQTRDTLARLTVMPVCDRLRLMFFGNLRQTWSDFVLAELGVTRFETVAFDEASKAFHRRAEVDAYLALQALRERLDEGLVPALALAMLPEVPEGNLWLVQRRVRLLLSLGKAAQRQGDDATALECYRRGGNGEPRVRRLRLLERRGDHDTAMTLAEQALAGPVSEAENQALARLLPRLARKLGRKAAPREPEAATETVVLALPRSDFEASGGVERAVRDHLYRDDAPVFYVENTLIAGLFGLLCWDVVFAPLPGAFFHPYHHAPADLWREDFTARRRQGFERALAQVESGGYREKILATWHAKQGLSNPFVHWDGLDEALIRMALDCLPPEHCRACFERLLVDPSTNRAGLPDLIQFFPRAEPGELRYRMIEVKAPGDRLQDNQRRWLTFFARQGMPVRVCHVVWTP